MADPPTPPTTTAALELQITLSEGSKYLFPATRKGDNEPYMTDLQRIRQKTLRKAELAHSSLHELRRGFGTRLSAGGAAERFDTQALRQEGSRVVKHYGQARSTA